MHRFMMKIHISLMSCESDVLRLLHGSWHDLPVYKVLSRHPSPLILRPSTKGKFFISKFFDVADPLITLLPSYKIKSCKSLMIGCSPILPVVLMVSDFMRVDTVCIQYGRHRVIERLQRSPWPMEKVITAGVHFSTRWHARHWANIKIIKLGGDFR